MLDAFEQAALFQQLDKVAQVFVFHAVPGTGNESVRSVKQWGQNGEWRPGKTGC
ncbi:hypothetical protein [Microbulbifer taiwanensis]|uniref:hypothetical protein n=1 Tax=Microbulbifer taiwanensis TaxID=986746 RepID=UPI0036114DC5